jgi:hypothetical protein
MQDMKTDELHLEVEYLNYDNGRGDYTIYNNEIKKIVTKEQFKAAEYEVN